MKTLRLILFAAVLALGICDRSQACNAQVTTLTTSAASVIVKPGTYAKVITIQNTGSNNVSVSIDGGTGYVDQQTGQAGSNPTAALGILVPAGQYVTFNSFPSASGLHRWIVAIMVSGTTTLRISTDDSPGSNASSQFPTP